MAEQSTSPKRSVNRRSLLKGGLLAGGAAVGAGMLGNSASALGQGGSLSKGDIAILQFLAVAETIEADLWVQYNELGGIGDNPPAENDPNQLMNPYQKALSNLDGDGPQYIASNTLDEISHKNFLNAYLESQGASPVNLERFQTLPGSQAFSAGSSGIPRLTNLLHLNVDTSWFTRYRSQTNPDLGGGPYPQAVEIVNKRAIPANDSDLNNPNLIQVIANIAAFHFGAIEQGGTSLYPTLAQQVSNVQVLEILLGIGGDEIAHFLEWVDFAGNACQTPVAPITAGGVTFPNLFADPRGPLVQPSLIFPIPAEFISASLPVCSVIRPLTSKNSGARAAIAGLTASGLFTGQSQEFFSTIMGYAERADAAVRSI